MDYIKINNKPIPYPNDFQMTKEANVVSELTTMSGKVLADVNGWRYSDTTFQWDTLRETELNLLLSETMAVNGAFDLTFDDVTDGVKTVTAYCKSSITTKTRFRDDNGHIVWSDVQLSVSFPECYQE